MGTEHKLRALVLLKLNCKVSWSTKCLLFKMIQLYPYTETIKYVYQKHYKTSHWNTVIQFKTQTGIKIKQTLKLHSCGSCLKAKSIPLSLKVANVSLSGGITLRCFWFPTSVNSVFTKLVISLWRRTGASKVSPQLVM